MIICANRTANALGGKRAQQTVSKMLVIQHNSIFILLFVTACSVIVSDARSLLGKLNTRKMRNINVVDRFSKENSSIKDAWEVNQGLNSTFFQGDIVLTADMLKLLNDPSKTRRKRAIKKDPAARWKNGVVAYHIDRKLKHAAKIEIRKAIRHWRKHTCISFHKKRANDADYLRFVAEDGCWSSVGRKGGKQDIGVGKGCEYSGTIIHEIGHALGFWHEQSRNDRDLYVRVVWKNIEKKYHAQFDKMDANLMDSMGYAYDYESVMHYGSKFFTKNDKDTIRIRKPGLGQVRIGQRKRLSDIDVAQINAMYNCNKIATSNSAKCIKSRSKGRDYDGKLSYTEKGVTCQAWNSNWPHKNSVYSGNYFIDYTNGLMERNSRKQYMYHNYCRNPLGKRKRPWCYTTLTKPSWQYCDLKIC